MTKRGWLRIGAGAAAVAFVVAGVVLWRDHRESLAKAALVAEIRAERAARPRPVLPAPTEEEVETARLYGEAVAAMRLDYSETDYYDALDLVPWTSVPKAVEDVLAANADCLAIVDRATARGACRFGVATTPGWSDRSLLAALLEARGHAALARGEAAAAAEEVRRLVRLGRDFGEAPRPGESDWDGPWPGLHLVGAEQRAAKLLAALATAPGLSPEAVPSLLAAATADWRTAGANRRGIDENEDANDAALLVMLGPEGQDRLDEADARMAQIREEFRKLSASGSIVDEAKDKVREALRDRASVPDAEGVRSFRALRAPVVAAVRRRDMVELAPGGPHDAIGGLFGFMGPRWFRHCVANEARIAVARTAAAVRAFQLREGRPPRDLGEVAPLLPPDVTLDPFDGKPLGYEVSGDGWRVSSRAWRQTRKNKDGTVETDPPVEVRFPRPAK